ncbi:hypothetical protein CYMTET_46069 [Cymbomonas tetramitiformis]|uniref:Uncharacterized protein n=1 Tax=Cymbomonas tetramitiformis TaxID=36881 RepID=A0AAE0EXN7_9CHLO|nr:hypothetical protein CYMTET_46069 [Cymbomonas tetramitiformis]
MNDVEEAKVQGRCRGGGLGLRGPRHAVQGTRVVPAQHCSRDLGNVRRESVKDEETAPPMPAGCPVNGRQECQDKTSQALYERIPGAGILVSGLEDAAEAVATLNREEWVNIFVGPPCNVDSCISLIKRKNEQGRYIVPNTDKANYLLIDSEIQKDMKEKRVNRGKEKENGDGRANGLGMIRQPPAATLPPDDIRKAMLMLRRQQQLVDRLEKQHLQTQKRMDIMRKEQLAQRNAADPAAAPGSELEVYGANDGGRGNQADGNTFSSFLFGG